MKLCYVDCETTGLDPDLHEVWEVGLIVVESGNGSAHPTATEHLWQLGVKHLERADPYALQISGFLTRHESLPGMATRHLALHSAFAHQFWHLTRDGIFIGAVPAFDAERIGRLLRAEHLLPLWHYHLVDVETLVAGVLGVPPPWKSDELSQRIGVDPTQFARHTALGDCRWARAQFEAAYRHRAASAP